eukprot:s6951_g1.t1
MTAITALAHLPAADDSDTGLWVLTQEAILFFVDVSEHCGFNLATQVALFHSIKPLFRNRPLLIILNKTDLRKISELSAEEKQLLDSMAEVEAGTQAGVCAAVHFFETSCATKNGVDSALQKGCELLLERRVEQKVRTGKADSLRNRLHITAVTPPASRPPCIPLSVQQKRSGTAPAADGEAGEQLERERMEDPPGTMRLLLREHAKLHSLFAWSMLLGVAGTCPNQWHVFQGRCYRAFEGAADWDQAKAACESYGATLASIHSEAENDHCIFACGNVRPFHQGCWIGGTDRHPRKRNVWVWVDGSPLQWSKWFDHGGGNVEPNNDFCTDHRHCSRLRPHSAGFRKARDFGSTFC